MILRDLLQLVLFICLLAALSPLLGRYVHQVFSGRRTFLHPVLGPVERGVYTLSGIHPDEKQTWGQYAVSVIGFSPAGLSNFMPVSSLQPVRRQAFASPTGV